MQRPAVRRRIDQGPGASDVTKRTDDGVDSKKKNDGRHSILSGWNDLEASEGALKSSYMADRRQQQRIKEPAFQKL